MIADIGYAGSTKDGAASMVSNRARCPHVPVRNSDDQRYFGRGQRKLSALKASTRR